MGQLACFSDPKSYDGGSVTTPGRVTLARQVDGQKPDEESLLVLQVGVGQGVNQPLPEKAVDYRNQ